MNRTLSLYSTGSVSVDQYDAAAIAQALRTACQTEPGLMYRLLADVVALHMASHSQATDGLRDRLDEVQLMIAVELGQLTLN